MTPQERKNFEAIRDNVHGEQMTAEEQRLYDAGYTNGYMDCSKKLHEKQIQPSADSNTHQQEPVACAECEQLKAALKKANNQAEHFEREWYLRGDEIEKLQSNEQEHKCNPHPKAPHGFNRNASHANDRYTCDCESWDAYEAGYQEAMARIEQSTEQEPVMSERESVAVWLEKDCDEQYLADRVRAGDHAKEKATKGRESQCGSDSHLSPSLVGVGEIDSTTQKQEPVAYQDTAEKCRLQTVTAKGTLLHTYPSQPQEHLERLCRIMGTFDLATGHADTMDEALDSLESELRDVLGHYREALKNINTQRCQNCASLEAQNTELDAKLAEFEQSTEQEPVVTKKHEPTIDLDKYAGTYGGYTTPPQRQPLTDEPVARLWLSSKTWKQWKLQKSTERNFCERCGKRLVDGHIHTCTPPTGEKE